MGHPLNRQPWANSPFGNALGVAVQRPGHKATKLGVAIAPSDTPGHWPSGYLGGLQLLPGTSDRWIGVINASPSAPNRDGDLAFTDSEFPIDGWKLADEPFEWIEQIPAAALDAGDGVNLWRQHVVVTQGTTRLLYNSGKYGTEQMYSKELIGDTLG